MFALKKGYSVAHSSKLKLFNAFLDKEGLIRVGARLERDANLNFDHRCP